MAYTEIKTDLVINKMTQAKYNELLASGQIVDTELYYITDDNDKFYLKSEVYTKTEIDEILANYTPGSGGGSNVIANPELDGNEEKLRGIEINSQKYSVMAAEMSFSDVPVESELKLANIQIGQDNWSIVSEALVNQKINQNLVDSKSYVDERIASIINTAPETLDTLGEIAELLTENDTMIATLNAAVAEKANAADVYTKQESDSSFLTIPELDANPNVSDINPRLTSLRVKGVDYMVLPEANLTFTGKVDENGKKTLTKLSCDDDEWHLPEVYLKSEVDNLIAGLIARIEALEEK